MEQKMKSMWKCMVLCLMIVIGCASTLSAKAAENDWISCGENGECKIDGNILYIRGAGEIYTPRETISAEDASKVRTVIVEEGVTKFFVLNPNYSPKFTNVASVELPSTLTEIADRQFYGLQYLKTITIPSKVTKIGDYSFTSTGLLTIEIPDSVTNLGDGAFQYCNQLTSVEIEGSLDEIGLCAFQYCDSLTEVSVKGSVTHIDYNAFANNESLKSVVFAKGSTSIDNYAFAYNPELTTVIIPAGMFLQESNVFNGCDKLVEVPLVRGITIPSYAFGYCKSLKSVNIESASVVSADAFVGCSNLHYVYWNKPYQATIPATVGEGNNNFNRAQHIYIHQASDKVTFETATNPTCVKVGHKPTYVCECGRYFSDGNGNFEIKDRSTVEIPRVAHQKVLVPKRPASCTLMGGDAHYECTVCHTWFQYFDSDPEMRDSEIEHMSTVNVDPLTAHNMTHVEAFEGNCFKQGYCEYYICQNCNNWYYDADGNHIIANHEDIYTEAVGHDLIEHEYVDSTCEKEGIRSHYECQVCHRLYKYPSAKPEDEITDPSELVVPKDDHYYEMKGAEAATCTENGREIYYECRKCHRTFWKTKPDTEFKDIKETIIPAKGHDIYRFGKFNATCTAEGHETYYECFRCFNWYWDKDAQHMINNHDAVIIPPTGHSVKFVAKKEPTCTKSGAKAHYECQNCSRDFWDKDAKKEAKYEDVYLDMIAHSTTYVAKVEPTCTKAGKKAYYVCNVCRYMFWDKEGKNPVLKTQVMTIPATGHSYSSQTTKATLTADGKIETKCSKCGDVSSTTVISHPTTFTLSTTEYTYNGKEKNPGIKVYDANGKAISSSNYTLTKEEGRIAVGTYKYKLKFQGNYSGTKTVSFKIVPKNTKISSVQAKKEAITVKWKKQSTQTTGYQIRYGRKSNLSDGKTITISDNAKTSKTIKSLVSKKKYYVQIRTYKKVGTKNYYSAWSESSTVTVK